MEKNIERIKIIGVPVDKLNQESAIKIMMSYVADGGQRYVVTPNPEIILTAQKNEHHFNALSGASLSLADGFGIKIAAWFSGVNLSRVTGADLTLALLKEAEKNQKKVAVLNWCEGLSSSAEIMVAIKKLFPDLSFKSLDVAREWRLGDYEELNLFEPAILFVGFGSPYQEIFLFDNLHKLPYVRLGLAIGGAFDFITGKSKRAPKIFRRLGLEWLWRLFYKADDKRAFSRKKRIVRIFRATVLFPWRFFLYRFIFPFFYRPNVACLLFKRENGLVKIFMVERAEEKGHWQIPQGGLDGKTVKSAGIRELVEESGSNKFRVLAVFKNLYRYKFSQRPDESFEAKKRKKERFGYKGQKQGLLIAEYFGQDRDFHIKTYDHSDWQWVDSGQAIDIAHPIRREAMKIFIEKLEQIIK